MTIEEMIARQSAITSLARSENRDLTEDETKEFNDLQTKIEGQKSNDKDEAVRLAVEKERARQTEISAVCRSFDIDPEPYLKSDTSVEECRKAVLETLMQKSESVKLGNIKVEKDSADKFREAAADGLYMRMGNTLSNPVAGAEAYRGMSLRDLAIGRGRRGIFLFKIKKKSGISLRPAQKKSRKGLDFF